ncbi:MAG: thioesterase family protein [Flavobacteriaceae bacterium]|nr:thioesterase family protein [Flavobacteriaceae bacterium]
MRRIRLAQALIRAKFKSPIKATDTASLSFRVWLTEIDISIMNHAAIVTVLEAGRIDALVRSTFFKIATKNNWYFPIQAITVQYYRPLKIFQKAQLYSKISFADEKWKRDGTYV